MCCGSYDATAAANVKHEGSSAQKAPGGMICILLCPEILDSSWNMFFGKRNPSEDAGSKLKPHVPKMDKFPESISVWEKNHGSPSSTAVNRECVVDVG